MEELDLLKKHWSKTDFPKIETQELRKMIQKRSSSTVRWILIISILEFVFWTGLNLYWWFSDNDDMMLEQLGEEAISLIHAVEYVSYFVFYPVIIYFMIRFYRLYRAICVIDNTKNLTESILTTNKLVRNYISFNVLFILINMIIGSVIGLYLRSPEGFTPVNTMMNTITVFITMIFVGVIVGIIWLLYRLLYGWLLKRLNKNYEELAKIEKVTEQE